MVKAQVLLNEARDEEVGMIVSGLTPQRQRHTALAAGRLKRLGLELTGLQKIVRIALVHQQWLLHAPGADQLRGIPLLPDLPVLTQITTEGFLAPRA